MKQVNLNPELNARKTRKREFLEQMEQVVSWTALVALIAPLLPRRPHRQTAVSLTTMPRVHFMQKWFTLPDQAMEEASFRHRPSVMRDTRESKNAQMLKRM